jgi:hypothetical protein
MVAKGALAPPRRGLSALGLAILAMIARLPELEGWMNCAFGVPFVLTGGFLALFRRARRNAEEFAMLGAPGRKTLLALARDIFAVQIAEILAAP